jgi:hypothetical protein
MVNDGSCSSRKFSDLDDLNDNHRASLRFVRLVFVGLNRSWAAVTRVGHACVICC